MPNITTEIILVNLAIVIVLFLVLLLISLAPDRGRAEPVDKNVRRCVVRQAAGDRGAETGVGVESRRKVVRVLRWTATRRASFANHALLSSRRDASVRGLRSTQPGTD